MTALGTVLGEIVTVLLKNELGIHEIQVNNDTIVVEDKKLLENKTTADALSNIANLTLHNDSIRDISVTYEKCDGKRENVCITKTTLARVTEYSVESEVTNYLQTSVTLEIVSPVFSDAPSIWKVRYNEVVSFIETNHRNPSRHKIEEHDHLNWLKANRKAMNAGKMKSERVEKSEDLWK